jgi:hypothetical protein
MNVRRARLEDAQSIGQLFRAHIERWQRMLADGSVEDVPYEKLTLYEQWQHGGAWMNTYTATLWLSHLLRGAGIARVLEDHEGQIIGYWEGFVNEEAAPFGKHIHIAHLLTLAGYAETRDALMHDILREGAAVGRVSVNSAAYDEDRNVFYHRYGFETVSSVRRHTVPTQVGQGFYRTTEHPNPDAEQIRHMHMLLGRIGSSRQQWETVWPGVWDAVMEIAAEPVHRLRCSASGQEALLAFRQDLFNSRTAEILCWSNKPFTSTLLIALRDWAHRANYRSLIIWGDEAVTKLLGSDADIAPQKITTLAREV